MPAEDRTWLIIKELATRAIMASASRMPMVASSQRRAVMRLPLIAADVPAIHARDKTRWAAMQIKNTTPSTSCKKSPVSWKNISTTSRAERIASNAMRALNVCGFELTRGTFLTGSLA